MPRILILYASLGSGHVSAAKALQAAFQRFPDVEVQIEDALEHANLLLRSTLTTTYERLSEKAPQLYRMIYEGSDVEDLEDSLDGNLLWAKLERPFFRRLEKFVKSTSADAIICVQQIPSRFLQLLEQEGETLPPHYVVITDMIAHSTWINSGIDGYFLPNDLTAEVLVQRGVDASILHVTGIPVNLEIMEPKSSAVVRQQHDWPLDLPIVTLFGGGLDPDRVRLIATQLLESDMPALLIVAAGRNEDLTEELKDLTDGSHMRFQLLGRIDYVDDLVTASDLVITKAGGLIVSEILARGTPMLIIDPFPGQEEWNADVVAYTGAGVQLRLAEMVPPAVLYLLKQTEHLDFMRRQAQKIGRPNAALSIVEKILQDLRSRQSTPELHEEAHAN